MATNFRKVFSRIFSRSGDEQEQIGREEIEMKSHVEIIVPQFNIGNENENFIHPIQELAAGVTRIDLPGSKNSKQITVHWNYYANRYDSFDVYAGLKAKPQTPVHVLADIRNSKITQTGFNTIIDLQYVKRPNGNLPVDRRLIVPHGVYVDIQTDPKTRVRYTQEKNFPLKADKTTEEHIGSLFPGQTLKGNSGVEHFHLEFLYTAGIHAAVKIQDFESGKDKIHLNSIFRPAVERSLKSNMHNTSGMFTLMRLYDSRAAAEIKIDNNRKLAWSDFIFASIS